MSLLKGGLCIEMVSSVVFGTYFYVVFAQRWSLEGGH